MQMDTITVSRIAHSSQQLPLRNIIPVRNLECVIFQVQVSCLIPGGKIAIIIMIDNDIISIRRTISCKNNLSSSRRVYGQITPQDTRFISTAKVYGKVITPVCPTLSSRTAFGSLQFPAPISVVTIHDLLPGNGIFRESGVTVGV